MEKRSFVLHCDSLEVIDHLSDEQVGKLLRKMKSYHNGNTYQTGDAIVDIAFCSFKNQFDRDKEKFINVCERNAINGSKGGRPRKIDNNPNNPVGILETQITQRNPKKPKKAESDSDSDIIINDNNIINNINISSKEDTKQALQEQSIIKENIETIEHGQKEYGNTDITNMLALLKKSVGLSDFKESSQYQRNFGKHFISLMNKIGQEEFKERLRAILKDSFKSKNCNKITYLYGEMKSFIHSPILNTGKMKTFGE